MWVQYVAQNKTKRGVGPARVQVDADIEGGLLLGNMWVKTIM